MSFDCVSSSIIWQCIYQFITSYNCDKNKNNKLYILQVYIYNILIMVFKGFFLFNNIVICMFIFSSLKCTFAIYF